jgi:RNA polymerase sigma-70 factor (ECF subfamily)
MNRPIAMTRSAEFPIAARSDLSEAFSLIARRHTADVYRLAFRMTGSAPDADDLVQETFLRAWRGLPGFRGESAVRTWLIRILLNAAGERRRRRKLQQLSVESRDRRIPDPADDLARRDLVGRVLAAVHSLPRRQREAMLLRARGGLSYREIAEVMAIRPEVVKLHLVAARKKLGRKFGKEIS